MSYDTSEAKWTYSTVHMPSLHMRLHSQQIQQCVAPEHSFTEVWVSVLVLKQTEYNILFMRFTPLFLLHRHLLSSFTLLGSHCSFSRTNWCSKLAHALSFSIAFLKKWLRKPTCMTLLLALSNIEKCAPLVLIIYLYFLMLQCYM